MTDTYIVDPLLWGLSYRHTALEGHASMAMAGFFRSVFLIQRARSLSLQRLKNARELRHNREEGYKNATRGFAYQKCIGNSQCEIMRSISSSVAPFREKMIEIGRSQLGSHHVICEVPCICRHALAFQMSSLSQQHGIPQLIEIEEAHGETDC